MNVFDEVDFSSASVRLSSHHHHLFVSGRPYVYFGHESGVTSVRYGNKERAGISIFERATRTCIRVFV